MALTPTTPTSKIKIPVLEKLHEDNFLPWQQLALFAIQSQNLDLHLDAANLPSKYASEEAKQSNQTSAEYKEWMLQDNTLSTWLLSSMDTAFKYRMIGCHFAFEIWGRIQTHFATATRSKIKSLKSKLKGIKKLELSALDYLLQIRRISDSLRALGHSFTVDDQIEAICDGLGEEYKVFITNLHSRLDSFSIGDVEAMLISHDEMLERFKQPALGFVQANLAQASHAGNRSFGHGSGFRARGRGGRNQFVRGGRNVWQQGKRLQCHVCGRLGHSVIHSYYRYNPNYSGQAQPSTNPTSIPQMPTKPPTALSKLSQPQSLSRDTFLCNGPGMASRLLRHTSPDGRPIQPAFRC